MMHHGEPGKPAGALVASELPVRRRVLLVMASVLLGMLPASLDQTVVGTAMPRIIADPHGLEHYAWTFTAYMPASTVPVQNRRRAPRPVCGRRRFLVGMALPCSAPRWPASARRRR